MTQDSAAKLTGISKRAYCAYEYGDTAPSAKLLAALAGMGIDITYLLTGKRGTDTLPADESELLTFYRKASPAIQRAIKALLLPDSNT